MMSVWIWTIGVGLVTLLVMVIRHFRLLSHIRRSILLFLARIVDANGNGVGAQRYLGDALRESISSFGESSRYVAECRFLLGLFYLRAGNVAEASKECLRAREIYADVHPHSVEKSRAEAALFNAQSQLALQGYDGVDIASLMMLGKGALLELESFGDSVLSDRAFLLTSMAQLCANRVPGTDSSDAAGLFGQAYEIYKTHLKWSDPMAISCLGHYAYHCMEIQKFELACTLHEENLKLISEKFGDTSMRIVISQNYSVALHRVGRIDQAEKIQRNVVDMLKREKGEHSSDYLTSLSGLGTLLFESHQPEKSSEGKKMIEEAASVARSVLDPSDPDRQRCVLNLTYLLQQVGDTDSALRENEFELNQLKRKGIVSVSSDSSLSSGEEEVRQDADTVARYSSRQSEEFLSNLSSEDHMSYEDDPNSDEPSDHTLIQPSSASAPSQDDSNYLKVSLNSIRERLYLLESKAHLQRNRGNWSSAEAACRECLPLIERLHGKHSSEYLACLYEIAQCTSEQNDPVSLERCRRDLIIALEILDSPEGNKLGPLFDSVILHSLAQISIRLGNVAEALELQKQVVDILGMRRRQRSSVECLLSPSELATTVQAYHSLGLMMQRSDRLIEAELCFLAALFICQNVHLCEDSFDMSSAPQLLPLENENNSQIVSHYLGLSLMVMASFLEFSRNESVIDDSFLIPPGFNGDEEAYDVRTAISSRDALILFDEALLMLETTSVPENVNDDIATLLQMRGQALLARKRFEDAEESALRSIQEQETLFSSEELSESITYANSFLLVGESRFLRGELESARNPLIRVVEIYERVYPFLYGGDVLKDSSVESDSQKRMELHNYVQCSLRLGSISRSFGDVPAAQRHLGKAFKTAQLYSCGSDLMESISSEIRMLTPALSNSSNASSSL